MNILSANWPAPKNITAFSTTRHSGFSQGAYQTNNLAMHVGDQAETVARNRTQLFETFKLPAEPCWLEQTHSVDCVRVETEENRQADAAVSCSPKHPLVILTADCLPILLCNLSGSEIAAIHAGWRGLVNGVIENTLRKLYSGEAEVMAWIGPAICRNCFEVGQEVYTQYINRYPFTRIAFRAKGEKWLADLSLIAELILNDLGIEAVFQSGACTFENKNDFYSYRREGETGRIGTFIWFNDNAG